MLKSVSILVYNIKNIVYNKPDIRPLGRWCHEQYNNSCNHEIKGFLANIDNSGHKTGLCLNNKKDKI